MSRGGGGGKRAARREGVAVTSGRKMATAAPKLLLLAFSSPFTPRGGLRRGFSPSCLAFTGLRWPPGLAVAVRCLTGRRLRQGWWCGLRRSAAVTQLPAGDR